MIRTVKVMLCPNNKQSTKLFECAGTARFIYNWVIDYEKLNYECDLPFINDYELRKRLTKLKKKHPKFMWLNSYSNNIAKQAVKDACNAYLNFFDGIRDFQIAKVAENQNRVSMLIPIKSVLQILMSNLKS